MFVRWQASKSTKAGRDVVNRYRAILVESVRVDGKPRQRHVAFLASYEPSRLEADPLSTRRYVWARASDALDKLGKRLSPEQRKQIERAMAKRIKPTTEKQNKKLEADSAARWEALNRRLHELSK